MIKNNADAIYKLRHIVVDFEMLQSGQWVPETDCDAACDISIQSVIEVIEYLEKLPNK